MVAGHRERRPGAPAGALMLVFFDVLTRAYRVVFT
jgi:hypothetical protein